MTRRKKNKNKKTKNKKQKTRIIRKMRKMKTRKKSGGGYINKATSVIEDRFGRVYDSVFGDKNYRDTQSEIKTLKKNMMNIQRDYSDSNWGFWETEYRIFKSLYKYQRSDYWKHSIVYQASNLYKNENDDFKQVYTTLSNINSDDFPTTYLYFKINIVPKIKNLTGKESNAELLKIYKEILENLIKWDRAIELFIDSEIYNYMKETLVNLQQGRILTMPSNYQEKKAKEITYEMKETVKKGIDRLETIESKKTPPDEALATPPAPDDAHPISKGETLPAPYEALTTPEVETQAPLPLTKTPEEASPSSSKEMLQLTPTLKGETPLPPEGETPPPPEGETLVSEEALPAEEPQVSGGNYLRRRSRRRRIIPKYSKKL